MTIEENELEIIEEFSMFDDWMDKYEFIIEIGKELSVFEDKFKVEDNLIKGCQSRVWVQADFKNDIIQLSAACYKIFPYSQIILYSNKHCLHKTRHN